MRESKRDNILDAAARVVEREGVRAVTYETVAAEAGLTKGGVVYHFTSREDMVTALHEHMAGVWEQGMVAAVGMPAAEASETQRLVGYARAAMQCATRAEMLFQLEGSTNAAHAAPWNEVLNRWVPPAPTDTSDPIATEQFLARLAADGLWAYESLTSTPLAPDFRAALANIIASRIPDTTSAEELPATD
ncbi:transcriptional regulator, TetR family [Plantibacter sp. VKM Ac-1784]|uniref:Transcriptional regulator, TetR family n=1 Tax=Plantibacter elymi (nom. nud.) TaxID=199708 RepID=A0ABY1REW5_9MICO|nr:TetR/AcrR family transcriptional regulator [Plantibacter sp. VKM Ac-1784]SMQ71284.1 transcriptional regulator, TetR family [Plantibacter sp. VKM Ac-1784]